MKNPAVTALLVVAMSFAAIAVHNGATADVADVEPSSGSGAADPELAERSAAEDWGQLSPEAYRAKRAREEDPVSDRAFRRQTRTRPEWLVLEDPNSVTPEDKKRVHQAGMLLAAGIPATLAGAFALGFGSRGECNQGFIGSGVFLTTVGVGLDVGGLIALAGASKEARRARKSAKHRRRLAGAAVGSLITSAAVAVGPGIAGVIGCD